MLKKDRLISIALVLASAFLLTQISFASSKNFALKFDAKKDNGQTGTRVIVDHSEELSLADKLTLEAWIYPTALDSHGGRMMIAGKPDTWMHALLNDASTYQGAVNATQWAWEGTGKVSLDRWTHVALSFDGHGYLLHIDGELKDQVTNPGKINTSVGDVYIGWLPQWNEAFTGLIDEVRISNTSRYPASNFPIPTTEFEQDDNTVLLMHFNEGQGSEAKDASAFEHHGLIDGATWEAADDAPFKPVAVEPDIDNLSTTWDKLKGSSADINGDGVVNIQDLVFVAGQLGQTGENDADVNGDGVVNIQDLVFVAGHLGSTAAAPSAHPQTLAMLTSTNVEGWLIQAQELQPTDAISQRGILFLEQLFAALTPKETVLLPNYPNPFNPETWIPYQLVQAADVKLTIYDINGTVVRQLDLGHQAPGFYTARSKAAYWDGRNTNGEGVASGVYFYQFQAGDYSATRQMVILK